MQTTNCTHNSNYLIPNNLELVSNKNSPDQNDSFSPEISIEIISEKSDQDTILKLIEIAEFKILEKKQIIDHIENIQVLESTKQKITNEHIVHSINQQIDGIKLLLLKHSFIYKNVDSELKAIETQQEIEKLKSELSNLEQDFKKCQNNQSELQKKYSKVHKDADTFFHENRKLKRIIEKSVLDVNKYKTKARTLYKEKCQLERKIKIQEANLEIRLEKDETEKNQLKRKYEKLENECESHTKKMKITIDELESSAKLRDFYIVELESTAQVYENTISTNIKECEEYKKENARLQSIFQKEVEKNQALMDLFSKFKNEFAAIEDSRDTQ